MVIFFFVRLLNKTEKHLSYLLIRIEITQNLSLLLHIFSFARKTSYQQCGKSCQQFNKVVSTLFTPFYLSDFKLDFFSLNSTLFKMNKQCIYSMKIE